MLPSLPSRLWYKITAIPGNKLLCDLLADLFPHPPSSSLLWDQNLPQSFWSMLQTHQEDYMTHYFDVCWRNFHHCFSCFFFFFTFSKLLGWGQLLNVARISWDKKLKSNTFIHIFYHTGENRHTGQASVASLSGFNLEAQRYGWSVESDGSLYTEPGVTGSFGASDTWL